MLLQLHGARISCPHGALNVHVQCDCPGNICLLLVLPRSVTPRATGHAHRPRLHLSKHTHPSRRGGLAWPPLLLPLLPCVAQANSDAIEAAVPHPGPSLGWPAPAGPRVGIQNGLRSRNPASAVLNTTVSAPPIVPVRTGIPGTDGGSCDWRKQNFRAVLITQGCP